MTLTLEVASLLLSVVALFITVTGFFASLKFYKEGLDSQTKVQGLLDRVDAKVEVLTRDVGGMVKTAWDHAFRQGAGEGEAQARSAEPTADQEGPIALLIKETQEGSPPGSTLGTLFMFRALRFTNANTAEGSLFFGAGQDQGFNLFDGPGPRVVFYGHFYRLEPADVVGRVRVLIQRLNSMRESIMQHPEIPNRDRLLELLNATRVIALAPPESTPERIVRRIADFQPEEWHVPVTVWTPDTLAQELQDERRKMEP